MLNYGLEHTLKHLVCQAVSERHIYHVTKALVPVVVTREVLAELMETASKDSIRGIEGDLNTVSVMTINVDIPHARIATQEIENGYEITVDKAKAGGLNAFLHEACLPN